MMRFVKAQLQGFNEYSIDIIKVLPRSTIFQVVSFRSEESFFFYLFEILHLMHFFTFLADHLGVSVLYRLEVNLVLLLIRDH